MKTSDKKMLKTGGKRKSITCGKIKSKIGG